MRTRTSNRVFVLSVAFLVLSGVLVGTAAGGTVEIVIPPWLADVEGDTKAGFTAEDTPFRTQWLFPAAEFAALPETHRWIVGVAGRPDKDIPRDPLPGDVTWADLQIRISTTTKGPGELDEVFANNFDHPLATVHQGPLTYATQAVGPAEGPLEFDYYYPFQTPYFYDPTAGNNLLLDYKTTSGWATAPWFDAYTSSPPRSVLAFDPDATTGQIWETVWVAQFIFAEVPEPSSIALVLVIAIAGLIHQRGR